MRSLETRLKRLEDRAKRRNARVPSRVDFDDANARQQTRRLYSAKSRLMGEDRAWRNLSDFERETLENDTPEQRTKDEDIEKRSRGVHGSGGAETVTHANRCKTRLRSMTRVTTGANLMDRG